MTLWKFQSLGVISLDPSAEMCLISPGEENLLDFLELQQVLSTYDGDIRDPLLWPHEREVQSLAIPFSRGSS